MRFHVCDSLTGRIVGSLYPNQWTVTDPLRTPGTGTLTVPLPTGADAVAALVDLTTPRRRWVAIEDDAGRFIFGGPIPRRPARNGGEVVVSINDWRAWFFRAPLRPNLDGTRRNYIKIGASAREQTLIITDLATLALGTVGAPLIVVDTPATSNITREITALQLDRSIGEHMDSIMLRERGAEWYTYISGSTSDPTTLVPHLAVAFPERGMRAYPARLEYRIGRGGNVHDYSWPEGADASSRIWAVGDGQPPAQALASDQIPEIAIGADIVWEEVIGPLSGVKKNATAFEYAFAAVQRARGLAGTAEFSVTDERIPLGDISTGDRVRIILEDGWESADVPSARVIERTISGGRGQALMQRLSVDLADTAPLSSSTVPGELA